MTVQIFKPNIELIRQQAQKAREAEKVRAEQNGFRWIDITEGDNVFRLLPPTNSKGLFFKKVCNHYFNDTAFEGKIDKQRCITQTYEDMPGAQCPICDYGDRILAQRPDMKIRRWHSPGVAYYGQAISRQDDSPVPLARLVRITQGVKNWIDQQLEAAWDQGIDITDFSRGLDINVVRTERATKKGRKMTEYKPAIASLMGPTPVLTTLPEGVTLDGAIHQIVESMYDLEQIWQYPDDETLAGINKAASDIYSHYMREAYSHPGATVQVPGTLSTPNVVAPASTLVQELPQPQVMASAVQQQLPASPPVQAQVVQQQVQQPVALPPANPQPQSVAAEAVTPQQVAQAAVALAQAEPQQIALAQAEPQPPVTQQAPTTTTTPPVSASPQTAPTDRPACWGGANPRDSGGVGYDDEDENCLMCPHELTCMDACKAGA